MARISTFLLSSSLDVIGGCRPILYFDISRHPPGRHRAIIQAITALAGRGLHAFSGL